MNPLLGIIFKMKFEKVLLSRISDLKKIAKKEKKLSGFMIGNTSKSEKNEFYFTPLRDTKSMVVSGIIVYSETYAKKAAKYLDGKVDYILVDAEKKIPPKKNGDPSNIERRVKEVLKKTPMWVYKGNDLTVDAVDIFLTNFLKKNLRGIGGKKILIIGAGNIGFKIALQLVERGAKVYLCARNLKKLKLKVDTLNSIKPIHTFEKVNKIELKNVKKIAHSLDIIIGATNGKPVIKKNMLIKLKKKTILIDLGKGTFFGDAVMYANDKNHKIYRVDISVALEGQINKFLMLKKNKSIVLEKKKLLGEKLVSSGLLGGYGDIIIDDIKAPKRVLGVSDGKGDFLRKLNFRQQKNVNKIISFLKKK
tara:strand:- start:10189 stop:11277 length:1089 start_codon:yes stop_codon:yes gene_type:complete